MTPPFPVHDESNEGLKNERRRKIHDLPGVIPAAVVQAPIESTRRHYPSGQIRIFSRAAAFDTEASVGPG